MLFALWWAVGTPKPSIKHLNTTSLFLDNLFKMSKSSPDDLPPPYTESSSASPISPQLINPSHYTSHLSAHLSTLPSRIRAVQEARTTAQAAQDLDLITRLVPEVESFLSDLSTSPVLPPRPAELTLVPGAAVPEQWALSGASERRREGELVQLVRVAPPPPSKKGDGPSTADRKSAEPTRQAPQSDTWSFDDAALSFSDPGGGGDDGGEHWWWWRDEAMARRLAAHLQPRTEPKVGRQQVAAAAQEIREERRLGGGWGWGRKKPSGAAASGGAAAASAPASARGADDDAVTMAVRAAEVTFQRENEFGIWESLTGWGIVVRVRIRRP